MDNLIQYGCDKSTLPNIRRLNDEGIQRWFVPICQNNHWYYLKVDLRQKTILQYDSLNQRRIHYGKYITPHLREGITWRITYETIQQQHNSYDCGLYMIVDIWAQVQHGCHFSGHPSRTQLLRYLTEPDVTDLQPEHNSTNCRSNRVETENLRKTQTQSKHWEELQRNEELHTKHTHSQVRGKATTTQGNDCDPIKEEGNQRHNERAQPLEGHEGYSTGERLNGPDYGILRDNQKATSTLNNVDGDQRNRNTHIGTSRVATPRPSEEQRELTNNTQGSETNQEDRNRTTGPRAQIPFARDNTRTDSVVKIDSDLHAGDSMPEKPPNVMRLYSQNVNGISLSNMEEDFHHMMDLMSVRMVDVIGWSETNIEWFDYDVNQKLYRIMKQHYPGGAWKPSTSKIPMKSTYKPGGNLLILDKAIKGRTMEFQTDPMGRWVWSTLQGSINPITIIQLYVPGSHKGITSAYAQQFQQIQAQERIKFPQVTKTYYRDLNNLLMKHSKSRLILMGDFNQEADSEELLDLQANYNLRDVFAHFHEETEINTHKRGTKRIDFFLISASLIPLVRNVGYESFDGGIISDHRGMFLDLDMQALQKNKQSILRRMKSNQGKRVKHYRRRLAKELQRRNIERRIGKLLTLKESEWKNTHTRKLYQLDKEITKAMLRAEHRCIPAHVAPWSPKIKEKYDEVKWIKKKIRRLQIHCLHYWKQMEYFQEQCRIKIKELRQLRREGTTHRDQFLQEQIDILELKGLRNRTKILQNIKVVEELRQSFAHIRYVTKDYKSTNLHHIHYPTTEGWRTTTSPEEMEELILKQQEKHFSQASHTPVGGDFTGLNDKSTWYQNFLSSNITDTSTGIKKYFERLKTKEVDITFTQAEFKDGIKKWKETTTTSPSGRHLGHYHAQILPDFPEEEEGTTNRFNWIHTSMINLAIKHKVVYERWSKVITILLPKDSGTPKIHRLRPLNIYEADLNLTLKIILARRLLWKVEKENGLAGETWGSRRKRSAGDLGLMKLLTTEMSTLTRTTIGQIDLDAKSCYDRMIRRIVMQACYKHGVPEKFCKWFNTVLESQEHNITTNNGISKGSYKSTTDTKVHGIGQGSTAAPVTWLLLSSIIFQSMRSWAQGMTWESPDKTQQTHRIADTYVDDTTLWFNRADNTQNLLEIMETDLRKYQELLEWTGGALTLTKCFFNITEWEFDDSGSPRMKDTPHKIQIPRPLLEKKQITELVRQIQEGGMNPLIKFHLEQLTGIPCTGDTDKETTEYCEQCMAQVHILQKGKQDLQKSLGLYMTPTGDTRGAEDIFSAKNKTFGIRVVGSKLIPRHVQRALMAVNTPSVQYRFHGAPFSEKFLTTESNKMTSRLLPKLNMVKNHPLALRYAPKNRGGLALPHYYVIQGTTQIKMAIRHLRDKTPVGQLLHTHLQWT